MKSLKKILSKMNVFHLRELQFKKIISLFYCLILIVLTFATSCSDEGDNFQSFLEKNDGTEWLLLNEDLIVYIRLNRNKSNLLEQWSYNKELDCYDYNSNIFSPGDFEIKENSIDKLIIQGDMILSDFELMTFSRQDNILTVAIVLCEWQEETVSFNQSSVKVDNLTKCSNDIDKTNQLPLFYRITR